MNQQFDTDEMQKSMAINALAENFGKEFSPELLGLWLDLLTRYSASQVRQAVKKVIEIYGYKALPPFAVLKSALDDLAGTSEKALEIQAIAEWGILSIAFGKFGYYGNPELHPTTAHVLRLMGGWAGACQWSTKDMDFKRRDFVRLWIDSHGRIEQMQLGAGGVLQALVSGEERSSEPLRVGSALKELLVGTTRPHGATTMRDSVQ